MGASQSPPTCRRGAMRLSLRAVDDKNSRMSHTTEGLPGGPDGARQDGSRAARGRAGYVNSPSSPEDGVSLQAALQRGGAGEEWPRRRRASPIRRPSLGAKAGLMREGSPPVRARPPVACYRTSPGKGRLSAASRAPFAAADYYHLRQEMPTG
uniref:Uncharacterized protein n=1 Tax=Sphaerodactylus townsendi TaxID=933632 RepID=A0ACB8G2G3_9SAUR